MCGYCSFGADILEDDLLRDYPEALSLLLKDHTTSEGDIQRNIFWATNDYTYRGQGYSYYDPITIPLITGTNARTIMPRVLKERSVQRERSKDKAEVFTPAWVCNVQNNLIDTAWFGREEVFNRSCDDHTWETNPEKIIFPTGKTWESYVRDPRLEITCGEAPYLASRYDATTGQLIPLSDRIGLLDRKLRVVSENVRDPGAWTEWAKVALRAVYGYEWQGDNLFLAREALFVTFIEYYVSLFGWEKFCKVRRQVMPGVAYIVSWNVWQMDGLKGVVPGSCGHETTLFGVEERRCAGCREGDIRKHNGTYCVIRDWSKSRERQKIRFVDCINGKG